ncbi:hypothetical protein Sjap_012808 [Stephania japonica]|uniref:Uncharacterized protein n=1 Tax=Stephania japonica TaxID=461633 RepID=A0AAP0P0Q8_9MAGN
MARTKKRLRSADSAAEAAASVVENVGCVVNFADHSLPHPPPRRQVNELRSKYDLLANDLSDGQIKDQQRIKETESPIFQVDAVPIGPGAWMIWVSRVLEPSAFLWRTRNDAKTLRKALGDTVAWPIEYIEMEDI